MWAGSGSLSSGCCCMNDWSRDPPSSINPLDAELGPKEDRQVWTTEKCFPHLQSSPSYKKCYKDIVCVDEMIFLSTKALLVGADVCLKCITNLWPDKNSKYSPDTKNQFPKLIAKHICSQLWLCTYIFRTPVWKDWFESSLCLSVSVLCRWRKTVLQYQMLNCLIKNISCLCIIRKFKLLW